MLVGGNFLQNTVPVTHNTCKESNKTCKKMTNVRDTNNPKQQIWLRTAVCGGWCRRMALRNLRECQKRWWPLNDVIQETNHWLLNGRNKPIISFEKNEFHIPIGHTKRPYQPQHIW